MNHFLHAIVFCLFCVSAVKATEQEGDALIIRGKIIYTDKMPSLEEAFPQAIIPEFEWDKTSNYKGYSATWAVFEGQLYLVGLEGRIKETNEVLWDEKVIKMKFPVKVENWSGIIKETTHFVALDAGDGDAEEYDEVTMIVFERGAALKVELNKKVPVVSQPEEEEKCEQDAPSNGG